MVSSETLERIEQAFTGMAIIIAAVIIGAPFAAGVLMLLVLADYSTGAAMFVAVASGMAVAASLAIDWSQLYALDKLTEGYEVVLEEKDEEGGEW